MTDCEVIMQQALTALVAMQMEAAHRNCGLKIADDSIIALRAAIAQEPEWVDDPHDIEQGMMRNPKWKPATNIAQPEQPTIAAQAGQSEPVGWIDTQDVELMRRRGCGGILFATKQEGYDQTQVYTHPAPVRQPLTDAEIGAIHVAFGKPRALHIEFARAIEAAHGIAQPEQPIFTQKTYAYICQGCGGIYWAEVNCDCNTKAAFDMVLVSRIAQPKATT